MDDFIRQASSALRAGNKDEARVILTRAIKEDSNNEHAWEWMYNAANSDKERIDCLSQIVRINPQNEKATQQLNILRSAPVAQNITSPLQTDNLKKCPHCAEMINKDAKVCKFCGKDVDPRMMAAQGLKALGGSMTSLGCSIMLLLATVPCICVALSMLFPSVNK
jgi:NADH pyrophosphatase NudC (nudix superfamily)